MLNGWLHVRDCSSFFGMNDPQLAAALRSRASDALPELLDAYGDRLFSYCWCLLRNRENAQIAVRDALVAATAQIEHLVCDEWLGLWLYSLARAECLRREAVPAADADEPAARPDQDDADMRLVAWKAVTSMPADEAEALELDSRHDVDLRLVLGLSAAEADALLDRARRDLERALGAEITIRKNHACPDRAEVMSGWTGSITPAMQDRVLQHAAACSVCGPNLPRSVSSARVFALLPAPVLSSVARLEILEFFDDPRKSAYREFTVSRAADATGSWFLSAPLPTGPAPLLEPETPGSWFQTAPETAEPASLPAPESSAPAARSEPGLTASPRAEPPLASETLAPVIPLIVPPPGSQAPPRPRPVPAPAAAAVPSAAAPAAVPAAVPPAGRRRLRVSRIGLAAVAAVAVTAAFALVGFRVTPSSITGHSPSAAATPGAASGAAQPGGGADAALPARVKRQASASQATRSFQHSAATRTEPLAVAASQPGTSSPSRPGRHGGPEIPASTPSSAGSPGATGSLGITPDSLNLGNGSPGQLTLTAVGGPLTWSATTSSPLVTLSSQQGTLRAGQSVILTVTVPQGGSSGSAFVMINSAPANVPAPAAPATIPSTSQAVQVTWTAAATYQPRHPHPSPSGSASPSPSPSTSPSSPSAAPSSSL
jgi:DNA-directed RNA polymerase specialized sigma24 family protein